MLKEKKNIIIRFKLELWFICVSTLEPTHPPPPQLDLLVLFVEKKPSSFLSDIYLPKNYYIGIVFPPGTIILTKMIVDTYLEVFWEAIWSLVWTFNHCGALILEI